MTSIEKILALNTESQTEEQFQHFVSLFKELYRIRIFKIGLDVLLTKTEMGLVKFNLQNHNMSNLHGCCITQTETILNKVFGTVFKRKNYQINIKKLTIEVLAHEIAHALEHESRLVLESEFKEIFLSDLKNFNQSHILIREAIKQILGREIELYKEEQYNSEYLARFFEILARCKEVGGYSENFKFKLTEILNLFQNTIIWIESKFNESLKSQLRSHISEITKNIEFDHSLNSFARKEQKKTDHPSKWRNNTGSIFSNHNNKIEE